jgi:hypothetical protein
MKRLLLLTAFGLSFAANAQTWQVRIQRFYSLRYQNESDPAWAGWGGQVERRQAFGPTARLGWLVGAEVSQAGWGSQALAKVGLSQTYLATRRWNGDFRIYAMPGVALFRPRSLFAYRVGLEGQVAYRFGKRLQLVGGVGLSYADCPAYADYGAVHRFVDLPLHVGLQWNRVRYE